jgi:methionyl-tRNA formyltransferase
MNKVFIWKALFSQSGSEIFEASSKLGRFPDAIITNKSPEEMDKINPKLLDVAIDRIVFIPKKPTIEEYKTAIGSANLVTLHGFLRILPSEVCSRYTIFNGHPGLITKFPELKGKDPQAKVWFRHADTPYYLHGHVIHEVIPEVDAGKIVSEKEFYSRNIYTEFDSRDAYIKRLHELAIENWVDFLMKKINITKKTYAY